MFSTLTYWLIKQRQREEGHSTLTQRQWNGTEHRGPREAWLAGWGTSVRPSRPISPAPAEMATPRSSHHLSAAAAIAAAGISYPPPLPPTPHASAAAPHDAGAGGAARQIVDSLLARFLPLARRRIETAQAQVPPGASLLAPGFPFPREVNCSAHIFLPRVRFNWSGDRLHADAIRFRCSFQPMSVPCTN
jgi:hypothetical protein